MSTGTAGTAAQQEMAWGSQPQAGGTATGLPSDWASGASGMGGAVDPLDGLEFDAAEEGVKIGGGKIEIEPPDGLGYHLEIRNAEWPKDENGNEKLSWNNRKYINVQLTVLASVPGLSPAGSSMWHEIEIPTADDRQTTTKNGGTMFSALLSAACAFCVGCGIFQRRKAEDGTEQIIDLSNGTTKLQFATVPERLKGLQVIGRPKRRAWAGDEANGKKSGWAMEFPWGNGVSQIGDPQNARVPMLEAALVTAGLKRFQVPATQQAPADASSVAPANGSGKPATAAPVQQQKQAPTAQTAQAAQAVAPVAAATPTAAVAAGDFDDL